MTRQIKILLLVFAILASSATLYAGSPPGVSVVFTLKQKKSLGTGASLSPDATKLVYVGSDEALHVVEIPSGKERMRFAQGRPWPDVLYSPSFSPDGKRIVFSDSPGDTWYYPSDIYSVASDGTGLLQLTHSERARGPWPKPGEGWGGAFTEYFGEPQYSPDGSRILVARGPGTTKTDPMDLAITISPDGSGRRTLTNGKPLGWAASGKAIFVLREEERPEGLVRQVFKYDLASGKTQSVKGLDDILNNLENNTPLGKLLAQDTFVVDNWGWLGLVTVSDAATGPIRTLPLSMSMTLEVDDLKALYPDRKLEVLSANRRSRLQGVSSDRSDSYLVLDYSGEMLDDYSGGMAEVIQVVKIK
ncbi:MAG: hypothetical protein ABSD31_01330 [Candidatus Binataceae bacterium]|jgi:Tol biopolymer transport system component